MTNALSRGQIFDETLPLLRKAGVTVRDDPETFACARAGT